MGYLTLITGGSACGKSTFARTRLANSCAPRFLILTEDPALAIDAERIAARARDRACPAYRLLEQTSNLSAIALPTGATVVVDCLCNLVSNLMFPASSEMTYSDAYSRQLAEDVTARACSDILMLAAQCNELIVVTNEIACEPISSHDEMTLAYLAALSHLNRALAHEADEVTELVCGIPLALQRR